LGRRCYFHVPSLADHVGMQASSIGHLFNAEMAAVDFNPNYAGYVLRVRKRGGKPAAKGCRRRALTRQPRASPETVDVDASSSTGTVLITMLHEEPRPLRREELLDCLDRNLANPHIDSAHIFFEMFSYSATGPLWRTLVSRPTATIVPRRGPLLFSDVIAHANRHLPGRRILLASPDVLFDDTLGRLSDDALRGRLACLNCVAPGSTCCSAPTGDAGQAWSFLAPLPQFTSYFTVGWPGATERLAFEAQAAGVEPVDLSCSVRAVRTTAESPPELPHPAVLDGPRLVPAPLQIG
jgi:hypothetical protein